jgi:hypothetical protein
VKTIAATRRVIHIVQVIPRNGIKRPNNKNMT